MKKWIRGEVIGRGSFGSVNLAIGLDEEEPLLMAVKSAPLSHSSSIQKEIEILSQLQDCPQILRSFGHHVTTENGHLLYNIFLEYAAGGSLAHRGKLPESAVRSYTASVLKGLGYIHQMGFVHCDIKLGNILLCAEDVKIADFGLAKKAREKAEEESDEFCLRGTPLYVAPESVARREVEPPSDIWSLGCAVVEMITGKPAWRWSEDSNINALLLQIGFGDELPEIPTELSEEGQDFLSKCFVRDPSKRWTAEMLLQHSFVSKGGDDDDPVNSKPSPRSVLDFMAWDSMQSSMILDSSVESRAEFDPIGVSSPADRIRNLANATEKCPYWSNCEEDDWITIRKAEPSVSVSVSVSCSVSPRSDSFLVLEEMVQIDGKREENSDSWELGASTSSAVDELESLDGWCSSFDGSDYRTRGSTRCDNIDRFVENNRRRNGCGFFSCVNWDGYCNYSFVLDELINTNVC
eukprot:TRINITY_DN4843_c0_g1_i1.p1 TRINITY_DN4843_c0_g1~~TRINITY_DN4843_c0_g1_i1.p1  ORF type:complete len:464 (+),score=99.48 TRINITY_DN4843_c0_g1_i1:157-1548(+)